MGQIASVKKCEITQKKKKTTKKLKKREKKVPPVEIITVESLAALQTNFFPHENCKCCNTKQQEIDVEDESEFCVDDIQYFDRGTSRCSSAVTLERVGFNNRRPEEDNVRNNSSCHSETYMNMPKQQSFKSSRSQQDNCSMTSYLARKSSRTSDYSSSIQNSEGLRRRSVSADLVTENYAIDANPESANRPTFNLEDLMQSDDEVYDMNHQKRGDCIIFNVVNVGGQIRAGTEKDVSRLNATFRHLGFDVHIKNDPTKTEIIDVIQNYLDRDHSDEDCFACVVLSHGKQGHVFTANGEAVSLDEIMDPLKKCPSLIGKPKLFFIQACRGTNTDRGVLVTDAAVDITDSNIRKLSTHFDVMVSYATVEDFVAYRDVKEGSIYIRILTELLQRNGFTVQLTDLLKKVNNLTSKALARSQFCQVPSYTTTFRKTLVFTPKKRVIKTVNILYYDDGTHEENVHKVEGVYYI